jgi:hypothetical protein
MAETRGRKPKPIEQKARIGNPGGRKLPSTDVIPVIANREMPKPHRPLIDNGPGFQLWTSIWTSGCAWLRRDTDIELVMMTCEQVDERAVLRTKVFREQEWRDRASLRTLEKMIAQNLSALGFSPTDRARLGMNNVSNDAIQDFRDRIATKRATA